MRTVPLSLICSLSPTNPPTDVLPHPTTPTDSRYLSTYMQPYPGFYFTGDGGVRDRDGYIWITGRVDDVLNVSGHRMGSAEIESALVAHPKVAEAAVIGFPHDIKGEGICCYVTLKEGVVEDAGVVAELKSQVRKHIGPFATPDHIILTPALPKTRSGKIMRRVLRKIIAAQTDQLGDVSTLADPLVVLAIIAKVEAALGIKLPPLPAPTPNPLPVPAPLPHAATT
jgi:acetyl-CoA synthetase